MNIVFFTDMYNVGGGERNLIDLAVEFQNRGEHVIVFIPREGQLSLELEKNEIRYLTFGFNVVNRRWFLGIPIFIDFFRLRKIIDWFNKNGFKPDVIHCNAINTIPLGRLVALFYKVDIFWTCHGPWEIPRNIKKRFIDFLVRSVIAITPEIYDMLENKNKCLIPLGIKTSPVTITPKVKLHKRRILCIARWQKIKGQDILIRAFSLIKQTIPDVELHFFGGILTNAAEDIDFLRYSQSLVEDFRLKDSIFFHEFDSTIRNSIGEYDLLCIPSRYESFSITLLEGLSSGIITVAPNIGGPAYIIEDGISGVLFDSENYCDLAKKCIDILNNKIVLQKVDIKKRGNLFTIDKQAGLLKTLYTYRKS